MKHPKEIDLRIVYSAFCLGTVTAKEAAAYLEIPEEYFCRFFNEWLKDMPSFVLAKWDGVHYEEMQKCGYWLEETLHIDWNTNVEHKVC